MNRRRQLMIVVGLLGLSCLVQAAVIRRATTPGLDAVRFVNIARSIEQHGLLQTVRAHRQQPLFPVWLWGVHEGLLATVGESPSCWVTSAQLAAAIPLVLAVVPLYFLLVRLVGDAAALAGSFFFCLLPEVARLGADGLSDSTHLLFFCVAFWAVVEYLEKRKAESGKRREPRGWDSETFRGRGCPPLWMLLAGGATAVASLARVEVLVLAAALGLTLALFQLLPGRREAWKSLAAAAACFLLGLAAVWAPYLAATAAVTPGTAVARILGRHQLEPPTAQPQEEKPADLWRLPGGEPMSFDVKEPSVSLRNRGYTAATVRFGRKLADALGYWIGALALWGVWRLSRVRASSPLRNWGFTDSGAMGGLSALAESRPNKGGQAAHGTLPDVFTLLQRAATCGQGRQPVGRATDGDRFVQVFFLLFSLAALRFSAAEGYLAPRHLMPLVAAAVGAAGYGALEFGSLLARVFKRPTREYPATAWIVVAVAGACCLPQTLVRLHHSRLGHRAAADWLARQTDPRGAVLDTQGWTGLYSGRETYPYEEARAALSNPNLAYVVLEQREVEYASGRSRTLRWLLDSAGRPAAEFPQAAVRAPNQQPVIVYRWHPDRFRRQIQARATQPVQTAGDPSRASPAPDGGQGTGIAESAELGVHSRSILRVAGRQTRTLKRSISASR